MSIVNGVADNYNHDKKEASNLEAEFFDPGRHG